MKYGTFLFVQWKRNSGNREALWRTRFLLSEVHWNGLHKETWNISFVQPCGNIYKNIISISNPYCIKKAPSPMFF